MSDKNIQEVLSLLIDSDPLIRGNHNELARRTKTRQSNITRVINGETKNPSDATIKPWADHFGVSLSQMRGYEPLPSKYQNIVINESEKSHISEVDSEYTIIPSSMQMGEESIDVGVMTHGSMGGGTLQPDTETIVDHMRLSTTWLRENVNFSAPTNLSVITGYGDSMAPTYSDGDILLVDRGIDKLNLDAVYVLEFKGELYIKRIQRRPNGTYRMISDNAHYDPYDFDEKDLQELKVLGRVLWAWNGRKL